MFTLLVFLCAQDACSHILQTLMLYVQISLTLDLANSTADPSAMLILSVLTVIYLKDGRLYF